MITSMIKLYNKTGYAQQQRCFKQINHKGKLSIDATKRIIARKNYNNITMAILTIFDSSINFDEQTIVDTIQVN